MMSYLGIWEIAILALLREEPMHPYQMQRLLSERHKTELLALKPGSLYHAIKRLLNRELIEAVSTGRNGLRPERTTYRIRGAGKQELNRTLRDMVAVPRREPSEFFASLSFLVFLQPDVGRAQLEERAEHLAKEIEELERALRAARPRVQRIHLIESEYHVVMRKAELRWVRGILQEMREGLTWDLEKIFEEIRAARRAAGVKKSKARTGARS